MPPVTQSGRALVLLSTATPTRAKKTARRIITHSESVGIWFTGGTEGGTGGTGAGVVDTVTAVNVALPGRLSITKTPRVVLYPIPGPKEAFRMILARWRF